MTTTVATRISLPHERIDRFCRKWHITRMEVFGSVLRDDFDPGRSDIDVLVTFVPGKTPGLAFFRAEKELAEILGRKVEMSTRRAIEQSQNWMRRERILSEAQTIYGT
jgi:predicted nucleotidyltransferase